MPGGGGGLLNDGLDGIVSWAKMVAVSLGRLIVDCHRCRRRRRIDSR